MPDTIIDRLIVEGVFDPSGIAQGIQRAQADIASLRDLFAGAFQVDLPRTLFEQSISAAQVASRDVRQEFTLAIEEIRRRFDTMLSGADLGIAGQRQATALADGIQTGLQNRLADLGAELATELITPATYGQRAQEASNAAIEQFHLLETRLDDLRQPVSIPITVQSNELEASIDNARTRLQELRRSFANPGAVGISIDRSMFESTVEAAQSASREIRGEFTLVADEIRRRFEESLPAQDLGLAGQRAATAAADAIRSTMLSRLSDLDVELALEIIDPKTYAEQAKLAAAAAREQFDELRQNVGQFAQAAAVPVATPPIDLGDIESELQAQISQITDETVSAARTMENALKAAFEARNFNLDEIQAGVAATDRQTRDFEATLLRLRQEARGLVDPVAFQENVDTALQQLSQSYQARIDELERQPLRVKVEFDDTEFRRKSAEELDAAEKAYDASASNRKLGSRAGLQSSGAEANDLAGITRSIKELEGAQKAGAISTFEFRNSLRSLREEAIALQEAGMVNTNKEIADFSNIMSRTNPKIAEAGVAMRHMRLGAAQLAVSELGATGATANLANGLLVFAGGSGVAIAAALGVAAIAAAWKAYRRDVEAAEEQDKKWADATAGAVDQVQTRLAVLSRDLEAVARIRDKLKGEQATIFQKEEADFGERIVFGLANAYRLQTLRLDLQQRDLQFQAQTELKLREQAAIEVRRNADLQSARSTQRDFASDLAQVAESGLRVSGATEQFAFHLRTALAISRDVTKSSQERLAALRTANELINAQLRPFERQADLQVRSTQEQLDALTRLNAQSQQFGARPGIDRQSTEILNGLTVEAEHLRENAELARRRAATFGQAQDEIAKRLRDEAHGWDALADQIDADVNKRIGDTIQRARTDVANLTEDIAKGGRENTIDIPVSIDDSVAIDKLREVQQFFQDAISQGLAAGGQQQDFTFLFDQLRDVTNQINDALKAPIQALIDNAGQIEQQLSTVKEAAELADQVAQRQTGAPDTIADQARRLEALQPIIDTLRQRYDSVTAAIAKGGVAEDVMLGLLQTQLSLAQQLAAVEPPTPLEVTQLAPLQEATQNYVDAKNAFDQAVAHGTDAEVAAARERLDAMASVMDAIADSIIDTLSAMNVDGEVFQRIAKAIRDAFAAAGRHMHEISEAAKEASSALTNAGKAIGAFAGALDTLGAMNDQTRQIAKGMEEAANAAASFVKGDILGGVLEGVGALADVFSGIFGGGESEHDRIVRENTDAIQRNTARRNDEFNGLGGQTDLANKIDSALASFGERFQEALASRQQSPNSGTFGSGTSPFDIPNITDDLRRFGLTMADLSAAADEFGIQIFDKDGNIVGDALLQLGDEMKAAARAALQFTNSFDDQLQRLDLESRIKGEIQTPLVDFGQEINAAAASGASAITNAFQGVDLSNQAAVRAAMTNLLDQFENGTLDPTTLGSLSREDFLKFLEDGAGYLDSFNQSVADATARMGDFNLPEGFRRQALAFQFSDFGPIPSSVPTPTPVPVPNMDPTSTTGKSPQVSVGQIVMSIDAKQLTIDEFFDQFVEKLRQLGMQQSGDTMQTGIR
jgi:hypothetical protein